MATATELADRLDEMVMAANGWSCSTAPVVALTDTVRELRRIPDLEQRALTEDEVVKLGSVATALDHCAIAQDSSSAQWIRAIVARLRPQPIAWHEPVPSVWVAQVGEWSLMVRPHVRATSWYWVCVPSVAGKDGDGDRADTLDAAKSAAEAWVLKQPEGK